MSTSMECVDYLLSAFRSLPLMILTLDKELAILYSSHLAQEQLHLGEEHIGSHLQNYLCGPINLSEILYQPDNKFPCTLSLNVLNTKVKTTFTKWTCRSTSGFNVIMEHESPELPQDFLARTEFSEAVLEHLGSAIFAVTIDGGQTLFNSKASDYYGNMSPPSNARGRDWICNRWTFQDPQSEQLVSPLEQIFSTGAPCTFSTSALRLIIIVKDRELLVTRMDEAGLEPVRCVVSGQPIYHNKMVIGALITTFSYPEWRKHDRERLDVLLKILCEAMSTMMWIADIHGRVIWLNSKMSEFSGCVLEDPKSYETAQCIHPDDVKSVVEHWNHAGGKAYQVQCRMKNKHGIYRWMVTNLAPVYETSELLYWIGSAVDIQEWKEADEQNRAFQCFMANGKLGKVLYLTVDQDLRVTRCINEGIDKYGRFCDHHYVTNGPGGRKFTGQLLTDFNLPQFAEKLHIYRGILSGEMSLELDEIYVNDTQWQSIYTPIKVTRNDEDIITGVAVLSVDITELRNKEIELRQVEAERKLAEKANQMKGEFLAKMSHELRTPLGAVIGMCDLLSKTPLNLEQCHFLRTVQKSADALMNVINHILDYEKIESGLMTIEEKLFSLEGLVDDIKAIFSYIIHSKHLEFIQVIEIPHHCHLIGDPNRTKQILINLLNNAVKFTSSGWIVLSVHVKEPAPIDNEAFVHFQVQDTGIGISPEAKQNLFKAFVQEDSSTARMYGGSGLGLCISKQLASLMKGSINLISEIGQGTTVNLEVPFRIPTPESIQVALSSQIAGHAKDAQDSISPDHGATSILVVEDNDINKEIIVRLLKGLGFWNLDTASNGLEATSKIRKCQQTNGKLYNLILMDCQMPLMDGYEATRFIRQHLPSKNLPIIALTANAIQGDRERCLEAGMSDYVTKPITAKKLGQVILKWLQQSASQSTKKVPRGEKRKEITGDPDVPT